ncbi:hypothetical protein B0T21DRAFT_379079 [Apiosordaria backusii]|uniref:Uncharacterized protein n=1 Tax=Apiosordaria backusii TaxID=314023 RepID=A0AA39ZPS2_9PEZI|nr:hypothetical protein B0T21DRAFT_379079 [Apiosordaria backusii]
MSVTFEELPDQIHHQILDTITCPKCLINLVSASPSCLRVLQVYRRTTLWRLAQRAIPVPIAEKLDISTVLIEKLLRTFQKSLFESVHQVQLFKPFHSKLFHGHYCSIGCSASCFDGFAPCVMQIVLESLLSELWTPDVSGTNTVIEQAMSQTTGKRQIFSNLQMHHIDRPVDLIVDYAQGQALSAGFYRFGSHHSLIFLFELPEERAAAAVEQYIEENWGPSAESFLSPNAEETLFLLPTT